MKFKFTIMERKNSDCEQENATLHNRQWKVLKLGPHFCAIFSFPSLHCFLKLCYQVIRFVSQIFNCR